MGTAHGLIVFAALAACDAGQPSQQRQPPNAANAACTKVAETLASFKLGNYAEPEVRSPELAKQQAACEKARITAKEATCITAATEEWSAAQCAPRLFPKLQVGKGGDCKEVTAHLRFAIVTEMGPSASTPQAIQMIDKMMPIIERACVEDAWPQQAKSCVLSAAPTTKGLETCTETLPRPLRDKLQKRMTDAMSFNQ